MKFWLKFILKCLLIATIGVLSSGRELSAPDEGLDPSQLGNGPGARNLLSAVASEQDRQDFQLIAAPNGTIYLVENNSRNVMWSCPTGPPIYSSYHLPLDQARRKGNNTPSYVDYGEDQKLYIHTQDGKLKLNQTIEEYLKSLPEISNNREVTIGSTHACVLEIDPLRGTLLKKYGLSGSSSMSEGAANVEFYILRVDHLVRCYASNSSELWNLTTSVFDAELRCKRDGNSLQKEASSSPSHRIASDFVSRLTSSCWHKFNVHRFYREDTFNLFLTSSGPIHTLGLDSSLVSDEKERRELAFDDAKISDSGAGHQSHNKMSYKLIYILLSALFLTVAVYGIFTIIQRAGGKDSPAVSKRRKTRKSGKSIASIEEGLSLKDSSSEIDGFQVGRLFVSSREIAKGSNGTVVFEGIYEGRKVAVKRLVKALHGVAKKEVQNLVLSDQHPNIVRWHGVEYDKDFVYLVLERCICSLSDLISHHVTSNQSLMDAQGNTSLEGVVLWKSNGYPSVLLLRLMREIVCGLAHLHRLGIIHRDIKPQNILIADATTLCAKLSDMGISKFLPQDMSSLSQNTGSGSSGWQAPEQLLLHERQSPASDMFSLGCVFFFCLTGGDHPFGDRLERDINIVNKRVNLQAIEYMPEAVDLLSSLLEPSPKLRPTAYQVLHHPLFWESEMRLSFLRDVSDRIELEDRDRGSNILNSLEAVAPYALGTHWHKKMEPAFINNIGHYRRYRYDSVRDLLRVIRNKLNHYRELPQDIQELLGPIPEGFDDYFTRRFPKLFIEVYKVVFTYCRSEKCFEKYFGIVSVPIV